MLNEQKGNMYGFVTHTWNAISGRCPHECAYCYMKPFWKRELYLNEKELKRDLGTGNFIFVGSSTDMFAEQVSNTWIYTVLRRCREFPSNKYLFQSKNTQKMRHFEEFFPVGSVLGTTVETNRNYGLSKAPAVQERVRWLRNERFKIMVTIEPVLDFDLDELVALVKEAKPKWVNIGADSKGHKMPEPSKEKIEALIAELKTFTEVRLKSNLNRLLPERCPYTSEIRKAGRIV